MRNKKSNQVQYLSLSGFLFFLFLLFSTKSATRVVLNSTRKNIIRKPPVNVKVGVVLDMDTWHGKMGLSCVELALSEFYSSHGINYRTRLLLNARDSKNYVIGAAAAALDLLKNLEVEAIIGPTSSAEAEFIIGLGDKAHVPIISFSARSSSLSSIWSPYFIRAAQDDSSQVKAISSIVQSFGWKEAVAIYIDNEFGRGIIPFLNDAFQEINAHVSYRSNIPQMASDDHIIAELYKIVTMQTRVFIVHMPPSLGSRIFTKAKELRMMTDGYAWIITDAMTNELCSMNSSIIHSMQGVIGVRPYVPKTKELEIFTWRWKKRFQRENPTIFNPELSIVGLWAYDAAIALAMAVENAGTNINSGFRKLQTSSNSTDLESFGVSQSGPKLLQELLNTQFTGLAGDFHIVDGQLQSSAYEIVNVIGNGGRGIGFWTAQNGITREVNPKETNYSILEKPLGAVIWPGDSKSVPKGWVIPTNEKKLKIGVPVKFGFSEFIKVERNPNSNSPKITGYCIDVFDTVMLNLGYHVPYKYIPFETHDGKSAGTYDDLVNQVDLGKFDAVVGDITIIANRSLFVDFTLPFTESGISLVVPIKVDKGKDPWVFLRPLTWQLWATTFCSFVFIGFVIWVLEHRINEDFRGPPSHQVGLIFWFSFSTMVFAHREKVVSNLSRFVVIIWVFLVLILTQSYTASLTSMLTVEQLQPTVTDIKELIKRGDNIGYMENSFVFEMLKQMNFDKKRLLPYNSTEKCHDLLSKGSKNGGVAAVFDEIPYMRLFLAKYCSKYTMVQPTYKTGGFGFVFPIGSPLVRDVSRAILNVTEGPEMVKIEKLWFENETSCPSSSTSVSSGSLGLESFWALFAMALIASLSCLIIYSTMFLHKHWQNVKCIDPTTSVWRKIAMLGRQFDQKDLSSHTFKRKEMIDISKINGMAAGGDISSCPHCPPSPSSFIFQASPNTNCLPSPSSLSNHTERNFVLSCEQRDPWPDASNQNPLGQKAQGIGPAVESTVQNQDLTKEDN